MKTMKKKRGLYQTNKAAAVGTTIECPVCHTRFVKRQYSQAFCCTHCKDKFHNRHDGDRHKYTYCVESDVHDREWDETFGVAEYQ